MQGEGKTGSTAAKRKSAGKWAETSVDTKNVSFFRPSAWRHCEAGSFLSYIWIIYLRASNLSKKKLCIYPLQLPFIVSSGFPFITKVKLPEELDVFPAFSLLFLPVEKLQSWWFYSVDNEVCSRMLHPCVLGTKFYLYKYLYVSEGILKVRSQRSEPGWSSFKPWNIYFFSNSKSVFGGVSVQCQWLIMGVLTHL